MVKTYYCEQHGEFEHDCRIGDKELTECPIVVGYFVKLGNGFRCNKPIKRVYKSSHYSFHTDGFCGNGFA